MDEIGLGRSSASSGFASRAASRKLRVVDRHEVGRQFHWKGAGNGCAPLTGHYGIPERDLDAEQRYEAHLQSLDYGMGLPPRT